MLRSSHFHSSIILVIITFFSTISFTNAQSPALSGEYRWVGFWTDAGWKQSGILDVMINNSNGSISGSITNGSLKGTWKGIINDKGIIVANYEYPGYPQKYVAQGMCKLNDKAQLVAYLEFVYQNQKIGEGYFTLAPANFLLAASNSHQNNANGLANPFNYQEQNNLPNINNYRNDPTSYIDALVPGYSDLLKNTLNDIQKYGNGTASPQSSLNANTQSNYIESIAPGYNNVIQGALADIKKYGGQGTTFNSNLNTINLANKMMKDAFTLSPQEIERKYRGINALSGGIAAQNQVYNSVRKNELERQEKNAAGEARMNDFQMEMAQKRAEWQLWQSKGK